MYDIAVVGGGPAGLSAAVQARTRNKSVLIVGGSDSDGPLYKTERVGNYLGFPEISGSALLAQFQNHAKKLGTEWKLGRVLNIMPSGGQFYMSIGSDIEQVKAVVLASGVVRLAKYQGEAEYLGRGVSYCATCDGMLYRGRDVVVIGIAGDAPEEANFLQEIGCRVTYLSPKQPDGLHAGIQYHKASKFAVVGQQQVNSVIADGREVPCQGVFILRASVAPTDLLPNLSLENGYIAVDRNMATNLPGIYAAGDCTGLPLQISKAVGEGLVAGQRAAEYIDAMERMKGSM